MTHEKEIIRWAKSPDGTEVWVKADWMNDWTLTSLPVWNPNNIYIVDDKYAEIRREWIDRGKPPLQKRIMINGEWQEWKDIDDEPDFNPEYHFEYRIKPKQWYDDIPENGVLCWVKEGENKRWFADVIIKYYPDDVYPYTSTWSSYKYAKPMTKDEAMKFIVEGGK